MKTGADVETQVASNQGKLSNEQTTSLPHDNKLSPSPPSQQTSASAVFSFTVGGSGDTESKENGASVNANSKGNLEPASGKEKKVRFERQGEEDSEDEEEKLRMKSRNSPSTLEYLQQGRQKMAEGAALVWDYARNNPRMVAGALAGAAALVSLVVYRDHVVQELNPVGRWVRKKISPI